MSTRPAGGPDTVVLIHGLWLNGKSWEGWKARYEARGYTVIAESWPGMDDVAALREDSSAVEHLGIAEIVDHYAEIISALDRPAVKGITKLPLSTLRSAWPVLKSPANRHKTVMLSPEEFHYAFTNTMTEEESQAVYNAYAVPGPGRVLFQGALANFNPHSPAKVDFKKDDRAPLLLISGGSDHVVPAAVDASVAKHYEKSDALTEYKEFPGRPHYTVGAPGWEEVADYAIDWAEQHALAGTPA
jgi:pimeloyl-ACP methyl ester carboxylesterase